MPVKPQAAFGEAVRRLRQKLSLSQENLAAEAQLDRTYVSSLERGHRNPTLTTIVKVSGALRVSASSLLAEMEDPDREASRKPASPERGG